MAIEKKYTHFAVLGLGRFGMSIVQTLAAETDANVLACDNNEAKLQQATEYATHVVQVDITDEHALNKLGLGNFDVVILAIGEDFEASLTAAMIAKEHGVKHIIVKAKNNRQKIILKSIGVNEVILPEHEMGAKLARRLSGSNIMDILEESSAYTITEMRPMEDWLDKTVHQADIRRKHHLTILAMRRGDKLTIPIRTDTLITENDILIVLSENKIK
jgi:trk system potassium uptake protein TrkA